MKIEMVVLDFDKTITLKHTRGCILQTAMLADEEILKNFADIEFFRTVVPFLVSKGVLVAIATFADDEEESLLSGVPMIRKYLEVAFPGKSESYIPDKAIEAWNPENKDMSQKVVGKNIHLENIRKRIAPNMKKRNIVLFDDSEKNIELGAKAGYCVQYVEPAKSAEEGGAAGHPGGFNLNSWNIFIEREKNRKPDGGCILS